MLCGYELEDLMGFFGETESAKTEEVMDLADFLEMILKGGFEWQVERR